VRAQLASHGVNPGDVEARVATLTDEEARGFAAALTSFRRAALSLPLIAAMAAAAPIAIAVVLVLPVVWSLCPLVSGRHGTAYQG